MAKRIFLDQMNVIVGFAPDQDPSLVVLDRSRVVMKNAIAKIQDRVDQNQPMKKIRIRKRINQENRIKNTANNQC